jgi:hypothetical protein
MITPGTSAQPGDEPFDFAFEDVVLDFVNGIYTVGGAPATIGDLLEYDPACLVEQGMAVGSAGTYPQHWMEAKGDLLAAFRNGLLRGMHVLVEYVKRRADPDTHTGQLFLILQGTTDANTPERAYGFDAAVGSTSGAGMGVWGQDQNNDFTIQSPVGSDGTDLVNRVWTIFNASLDYGIAGEGYRMYGITMNGNVFSDASVKWVPDIGKVEKVGLFGVEEYDAAFGNCFVRRIEVLNLPGLMSSQQTYYSNRGYYPLLPVTDNLGKDPGPRGSYIFESVDIGTPAADRLVIVCITDEDKTSSGVSLVDINPTLPAYGVPGYISGIEAERIAATGNIEVWAAYVPTGTECLIRIRHTGTAWSLSCKVYTFNTAELNPYDARGISTTTGADLVASDLAVKAGGKVLAISRATGNASGASWTWTGAASGVETDSWTIDSGRFSMEARAFTPSADSLTDDLTCNLPAGITGAAEMIVLSFVPSTISDDPYFSSVKLLAGFDGADGATAFVTEESAPHALTFVGNAQLDTAEKNYGSASLFLDGTGDYLSTPDSDDWNLGSGAFTIEVDAKFAASGVNQALIAHYQAATNQRSWMLQRGSTGVIVFWISTAGTSGTAKLSIAYNPGTAWHRYCVTHDGAGTYRLYIDGDLKVTATGIVTLFNSSGILTIGARSDATELMTGWIDEVRITKGVCRNPGLIYCKPLDAAYPRS